MTHFPPGDEFLGLVAARFRMLSDAARLAILDRLMHQGELNVGRIVDVTGPGLANAAGQCEHAGNA